MRRGGRPGGEAAQALRRGAMTRAVPLRAVRKEGGGGAGAGARFRSRAVPCDGPSRAPPPPPPPGLGGVCARRETRSGAAAGRRRGEPIPTAGCLSLAGRRCPGRPRPCDFTLHPSVC